jgi:methionine-rich copper-binding protein CopC
LLLLSFVFSAPVAAHVALVAAEPAPGARLQESPAVIRLTFNERLEGGSTMVLRRADFLAVPGLVAAVSEQAPEQMVATLPPLEAGVYTVQWEAISLDGHAVTGSYQFTVDEVGAGAAPWRLWSWLLPAAGLILAVLFIARRGAKK